MKSLKSLIIPFIVMLLIIIGAIWCVKNYNQKDDTEETEDASVTDINLIEDADNIMSITVNKKDGEDLSVNHKKDGVVDSWEIDSALVKQDANYSSDLISSWCTDLANFTEVSIIETDNDLSDYGLDNPNYKITIKMFDKSEHEILFGNISYDDKFCYCTIDKESNKNIVYYVDKSKLELCDYNPINFMDKKVLDIKYTDIKNVTFDKDEENIHIKCECNVFKEDGKSNIKCKMISPIDIPTSQYFVNMIQSFATLKAQDWVTLTDEEKQNIDLDNPYAKCKLTINNDEEYILNFSHNIGGVFYCTSNTTDDYFVVNAMEVKGIENPLSYYTDNNIYYKFINEVNSISLKDNDGNHFKFELDVTDNIEGANVNVTLDGRNAMICSEEDKRNYAAVLFETLSCIEVGGIDLEATPEFNPVMEINFLNKDYTSRRLCFVKRDEDTFYVFAGDNRTNVKYTGIYINSKELYADGKNDTYSYGVIPAYKLLVKAIDNNINGIYNISD